MRETTIQLDEVLQAGLNGMNNLTVGSEEYETAANSVATLIKAQEEIKSRELEETSRKKKERNEVILRGVDLGLKGISLGLFVLLTYKGWKFEETGTVISPTTKGLGRFFLSKL